MANLTYWYAARVGDSDAYSIVTKTKREAEQRRAADPTGFEPVVKKTLFYRDAFDLFYYATSEGGGRGCGDSEAE
jgi:hypothetical protein